MFLREVRETVNAAIEPLRAAKTLATTAEADIVLTAPAAWLKRLAPYAGELESFLIVAKAELREGASGAEPTVEVARTALGKCDRCWTFRPDTAARGDAQLCSRCGEALTAQGR
jgi:isoleucyl-tRNA synthetase